MESVLTANCRACKQEIAPSEPRWYFFDPEAGPPSVWCYDCVSVLGWYADRENLQVHPIAPRRRGAAPAEQQGGGPSQGP